MKPSALILIVGIGMGATACGSSQTTPATPSNADSESATNEAPSGAASKQAGGDNPARLLTHDECTSLGELVSDACRDSHARSAQVDGWCSDQVAAYESGSWIDDCAKHVHLIDSMCFRTATNAHGMMDCDSTVEH